MHDRMPYSTWTFWFLAGGLATVGLSMLVAPGPQDEWVGGGEDVQEGWPARAADKTCAWAGQQLC